MMNLKRFFVSTKRLKCELYHTALAMFRWRHLGKNHDGYRGLLDFRRSVGLV
nr:hypothetical protein [uncultured bacterium]